MAARLRPRPRYTRPVDDLYLELQRILPERQLRAVDDLSNLFFSLRGVGELTALESAIKFLMFPRKHIE